MLGLSSAQPEDLLSDGSVNVSIDTYTCICVDRPVFLQPSVGLRLSASARVDGHPGADKIRVIESFLRIPRVYRDHFDEGNNRAISRGS